MPQGLEGIVAASTRLSHVDGDAGKLILAGYAALGTKPNIEYVEMPEAIRGSYQYFTEATTARLTAAGYNGGFTPLEDAVKSYVGKFLNSADRYR